MYRDKDGKYTEQRYYVEDMGNDVIGIHDRMFDDNIICMWSHSEGVAERVAHLLNVHGLTSSEFMTK